MGIQIASLHSGGVPVAVQQELQKEKPPPLPIEQKTQVEQKASLEKALAYLPGSKQGTPTLERTTADIQHISLVFNSRLKFIIDHESNEILIKVLDNETDKVIKVLPPEELQRLHSRIRETMGFLFDRMA
jgi:flagellar protein FlaG